MKKFISNLAVMLCVASAANGQIINVTRDFQLADSIMKYQMKSGGWPKNQNWLEGADHQAMKLCRKTGIGSTIDNGATTNELRALATACTRINEMYEMHHERTDTKELEKRMEKITASFMKGLNYLLKMQYENGGWPQYFPAKKEKGEDYSTQITFNDGAMVNVLRVLYEIATDAPAFADVKMSRDMRRECQKVFDRGLKCLLNCQIRVNDKGEVLQYGTEEWKQGKRTVWCQQHDKVTLMPTQARAYELPSYSGCGETVDILSFLMDLQQQDSEVRNAIRDAIEWLEAHVMKDKMVETFTNADGKQDIRIIEVKGATPIWARFYDLKDAEPMFCGRDGNPKKNLSEIEFERRNGYRWVDSSPQKVIDRYREEFY